MQVLKQKGRLRGLCIRGKPVIQEPRHAGGGAGLATTTRKIRVGISACLLGHPTRYDGAGKRDARLLAALGDLVKWVPVCPEVECGLPAPREKMRLEGPCARPRLIAVPSRIDRTGLLMRWVRAALQELARQPPAGFILKARSPSCGLRDVPVHRARGRCARCGTGLFARALAERFPDMPIQEAEPLRDRAALERFVARLRISPRAGSGAAAPHVQCRQHFPSLRPPRE